MNLSERLARAWGPRPQVAANTRAWIDYLDVDLEAAQRALRLPPDEQGWPPGQEPAAPDTSWDAQLPEEPPISEPPPTPAGPRPESLVAPAGHTLRGAYARRASR